MDILSHLFSMDLTLPAFLTLLAFTAVRGLMMFAVVVNLPDIINQLPVPQVVKSILLKLNKVVDMISVAYDVAMNVTLMTILFLDSPKGWHTFSYRLGYYISADHQADWRKTVATKICNILSVIQENHCTMIYRTSF